MKAFNTNAAVDAKFGRRTFGLCKFRQKRAILFIWLQLVERNLKVGSQSNSAPDSFLDENHPEISQIKALTAFWYE